MKQLVLVLVLPLAQLLAGCGGSGSAPPPVAQTVAPAEPVEPDPAPLERPDEDAGAEPEDAPGDPSAVSEDAFMIAGYGPAGEGPAAVAAGAPPPGDAAPPLSGLGAPAQFNLYVSPHGADTHPGTAAKPFRSLARAAKAAKAGTKVFVAPGLYSGGFRTSASGSSGARISFLSTTRWGAKIVPPKHSANRTAWDNRGSHVDIVGFEIDGSAYQGGVRWTHGIYSGGSYDSIRNNRVHHIAQGIACNGGGGAAIGVDSYFKGVNADVIANLVHDIGPPGCRFVQGIYVSTSGRIRNNVVYRVAEAGIHLWHDANNVVVTNNTVMASNTGIIVGGGNFYHSAGPNDHTAVYSNIVVDNRMGISEQGKTGANNTYRNNLVFQNTVYNWRLKKGMNHVQTVTAAPGFVGHARSQPDLKLASGSAAIGRATPALAESTDFDGRPRNASAGFDIGAFQYKGN